MSESKKPTSRRLTTTKDRSKPTPPAKIPPIKISPEKKEDVVVVDKPTVSTPPTETVKKRVRKPTVKKEVTKIPTSEQYAQGTPKYYGDESTDIISRAGDLMFPFADLAFVLVSLNKYSLRMFGKGTENLDTSKMVYLSKRILRLKCMKDRNFDFTSIESFKERLASLKQYLSEEALVGFLRAEIDDIITNFDPLITPNEKILTLIHASEQIHFILNPNVKLK